MKVYEVTRLLEAENEGINGSYPNPSRIRKIVNEQITLGHQRDVCGVPVKLKAMHVGKAKSMDVDYLTNCVVCKDIATHTGERNLCDKHYRLGM